MKYYQVIKSRRKTISIEVTRDEEIIIRAPYYATKRVIQAFVDSKSDWIDNALDKVRARRQQSENINGLENFTKEELAALAKDAKAVIPLRVAYYADILGVTYGRIAIRAQKTRWGSCSGKGNLNFNCLLMLVPDDVRDYVIVHELCHLIELNHSPAFWAEVSKVMPNYKEKRKWLKDNGSKYIDALP